MGDDRPRRVLILGPPRSGTTLLAHLLGGGAGVLSLSEPFLAHSVLPPWRLLHFWRRLRREARLPVERLPAGPSERRYAEAIKRVASRGAFTALALKETFRSDVFGPAARHWVNEAALGRLVRDVDRTIALVRHPIDTAASTIRLTRGATGWRGRALRLRWPTVPYFRDTAAVVRAAARNWRRYAEWIRLQPVPLVRYEEFVRSPAEQLPRVCEMIGVPFESRMLDHTQPRTAFAGLGDPGVIYRPARPVDVAAVGRGGGMNSAYRHIVLSICGDAAKSIGYEM